MKKILLSINLALCMLLSVFPVINAQCETELKRYIVILEEPALHSPERPAVFLNDEQYYSELRDSILELQENVKMQITSDAQLNTTACDYENEFSYTDVLNGFTITTDEKTAEAIKNMDGVAEVFPDEVIAVVDSGHASLFANSVQTEGTPVADFNPGNLIDTDYAYSKGYDGEGMTVAVLDSTINYENTFFSLSQDTNVKYTKDALISKMLEKGMDKSAESAYKTAKIPFAYDYEADSYILKTNVSQHGTHVSGIVAGNELSTGNGTVVKGVAPEAQIMFFGVADNIGNISFSVAAAALEDAVKLEADTINMSFGNKYGSENQTDPIHAKFRQMVRNAEDAGCFVNVSAGNSDKGGVTDTTQIDYSISDNITFPHAAKIGSVQGIYRMANRLDGDNGAIYSAESRSLLATFSSAEIVDCGNGTATEISSQSLAGKVAIIHIPDELLREKNEESVYYTRVKNAGAVALVLINNINQINDMSAKSYDIPIFYVSKSEGEKILANTKTLSCSGRYTVAKNSDMPEPSWFSSYGNSDKLEISVDYSAPGSNIYSAYGTGAAVMSGTSMAAPAASGTSILMYQFMEENYPGYTGKNKLIIAKNLLASTAETVYDENGVIASPRKVGSGVIKLEKAMQSGVILHNGNYENRITLGDEIGKIFTVSFLAENISSVPVTFDGVKAELSTDDYKYYDSLGINAFYGLKQLNAQITAPGSITIPAGESVEVSVTVTLNDADIEYLNNAMQNGFFVDGKITLANSQNTYPSIGIPFMGFYGDWEKAPVLDEKQIENNLKFNSKIDGCDINCELIKTVDGYIMPFTTTPDAMVAAGNLINSVTVQRNTFVRVKSNGDVVAEGFVGKNVTKNIFGIVNKSLSEVLSEGDLDWEFYLMSPYTKSEENAQIIKITVTAQNEKPVFKNMQILEEPAGKVLQFTAKGNYLKAIKMTGHNTAGKEVSKVNPVNLHEYNASFSLTGMSDASFKIYDSALNSAELNYGITVVIEGNEAIFTNNTFNTLPCVCIVSQYDDFGKLENIEFLTEKGTELEGYQRIRKDISKYADKKYKIFFWEEKTIKPYISVN